MSRTGTSPTGRGARRIRAASPRPWEADSATPSLPPPPRQVWEATPRRAGEATAAEAGEADRAGEGLRYLAGNRKYCYRGAMTNAAKEKARDGLRTGCRPLSRRGRRRLKLFRRQ